MALASRPLGSQPLASAEAAAPSGRTGTLSVTLGALTSSATGTVAIAGALSKTLGTLTSSATGTVALTGALSQTLGALTLAADGTVTSGRSGTLTATLGALTVSATGTVDIAATLGVTLGDLTLSATATNDSPRVDVAGSGRRRLRTRYVVRYDGREVEVRSQAQFDALVKAAEARAGKLARKTAKKAQPEQPAPVYAGPQIEIAAPVSGPSLREQIDAANAEIARAYQQQYAESQLAYMAARQAMLDDEEDIAVLIAMGHL